MTLPAYASLAELAQNNVLGATAALMERTVRTAVPPAGLRGTVTGLLRQATGSQPQHDANIAAVAYSLRRHLEEVTDRAVSIALKDTPGGAEQAAVLGARRRHLAGRVMTVELGRKLEKSLAGFQADLAAINNSLPPSQRVPGFVRQEFLPGDVAKLTATARDMLTVAMGCGLELPQDRSFDVERARGWLLGIDGELEAGKPEIACNRLGIAARELAGLQKALPAAIQTVARHLPTEVQALDNAHFALLHDATTREGAAARPLMGQMAKARELLSFYAPLAGCEMPAAAVASHRKLRL